MSQEPVDAWLESLEFEIYRLRFGPGSKLRNNAWMLRRHIAKIGSLQVADLTGMNLESLIHSADVFQQDLASLEELIRLHAQLEDSMKELRRLGFPMTAPGPELLKNLDDTRAWFEKTKISQRQRQERHLASLRLYWPNANGSLRMRMLGLFATYGKRRFAWGAKNLQVSGVMRLTSWLVRKSTDLR